MNENLFSLFFGRSKAEDSGVRVSNMWIMYLYAGNNFVKVVLILNVVIQF